VYTNNQSDIDTISLEQEFKLQVLSLHVEKLSQEQLRKLFLKVVRQSMSKDNLIKKLNLEHKISQISVDRDTFTM
jgi:Phycobilisome degradation protein nblA